MTTFEYATEIVPARDEKKTNQALEQLGSQGWELVSAVPVGLTHTRLFFKRPVTSGAEVA
ncbi:hypothetical protein [Limimaricola sp. AA108-03]|uniref:hypothetical protein n=1 Tax=Limimaricola sp. AA108-03 TaxID=3425945 RepID=UPI003D78B255